MHLDRIARTAGAAAALATLGACAQAGQLGSVLGGVLGTPSGNQVSGTVQSVDTRNQVVNLRQSNGQTIAVSYDAQTQVVYNNQNYQVTSLEYGDGVTARIQTTNNGGYYTDLIQVDQPVNSSAGTSSSNVQSLQGTVRQVDVTNGWFTVDAGSGTLITVSLPYNVSRTDQTRFQNLRSGDYVRFYGVYLNNTRVELRQFY